MMTQAQATTRMPSSGGASLIVYEDLKRRAFDGDFDRMHAWSKAQFPVHNASR